MGGHANIDAKYVAASGNIVNGGSSSITGTEVQNAPPTNDPLPQLQQSTNQPTINTANHTCTAPASATGMSCIYDGNVNGANGALNGTLSGTLQANTIYVFDGAVNSGNGPTISGNVTGSNVTLYLAGNTPFDFANNGTLSLSPPGYQTSCLLSTNPFCGILIDAPSDGSNNNGTYTCSHGKGNNYGNPGEIYLNFGSSSTTLRRSYLRAIYAAVCSGPGFKYNHETMTSSSAISARNRQQSP